MSVQENNDNYQNNDELGDKKNIEKDKNDINRRDLKWNKDDDVILKEWADKSACFKLLHEKSYKVYKKQYLNFMIPVIVISTLTGAANFALERIPDQTYQGYASLVVGAFNIVAAIISTVAQFLKTSELKEGHNIAARSWDKFNRTIKLELQKNPDERTDKRDLFTYSMKEYDRLVELSPDIPTSVIKEFNEVYKNTIDLIKPEITGVLVSSKVYEKQLEKLKNDLVDIELESELDQEMRIKHDYIEKFKQLYSRPPTTEEINDFIELNKISVV
jgi:hypothetical protein